ncbi:MAG TPA: phosphoribosylformylglycinamidine cyclo-ligase [Phycisphaerae bacterium]|nr:phosphoribosylformylglycinamidine cyclo-ligase [Phycisphaerae bacterium]
MAQGSAKGAGKLTYKAAGVDITANDRMVDMIQRSLRRTHDPRVLSRGDTFAGLMCLDYPQRLLRKNYREPVLVAGADGVGSKLLLGMEAGRMGGLGIDLVAMSVNDVLTMGAEPLFFLDYIACHELRPAWIAELVEGVSRGCIEAGCALLGGETAEMPDLYKVGHFDLAGFGVGVVERKRIIDGRGVEPGDVVLGLASSGVHSNGYALVRRLLKRLPKGEQLPEELVVPPAKNGRGAAARAEQETITTRRELIHSLLRPTRIYAKSILAVLNRYRRKRAVRAMAHITGSGLEGNVPRVVPENCDVCIARGSWPVPTVFRILQRLGVDEEEMYRVFNMGIGYVLVVRPLFANSVMRQLSRLGETVYRMGAIRRGSGKLVWK